MIGLVAALVIGGGVMATSPDSASADCNGCTNTSTQTAANAAGATNTAGAAGGASAAVGPFAASFGGDAKAIAKSKQYQKIIQKALQLNLGF
jgi:hypothetical protein